jgi:hypothetical protein
MRRYWRIDNLRFCLLAALALAGMAALGRPAQAVELKMSRDALERTLKQQLFGGPDGRYYLKGTAKSACSVYAEKPELSFAGDRVVIKVKIEAKLGTAIGGKCIGIGLTPTAEVSVVPSAEGETIGFRDARVEKVSDSKELNFLLTPFLSHQIPSNMKVNAAELLRKSIEGSTLATGYNLTLDRLKVHSMTIETGLTGDWLVVDVDGDMSVK